MQKNGLLGFLKNGSDYYPFGEKIDTEYHNNSSFVPYEHERNKIGKLEKSDLRRCSSTKKIPKQNTETQQISESEPVYHRKMHTDLDSPKYDPNTLYLTILPTNSNTDYLQKSIDTRQYTLNHNQVERGLQIKKQNKAINHKFQLVGKKTKSLAIQIPALGVYNPTPISKHLPNIQIKSKSIQKLPEIFQQTYKPNSPVKKAKRSEFEMMFAKQIATINREVDQEMKRNPNQRYHVDKFDVNENLDLNEAEQLRNRMKTYFQSVKESLTKIKNLINIKR